MDSLKKITNLKIPAFSKSTWVLTYDTAMAFLAYPLSLFVHLGIDIQTLNTGFVLRGALTHALVCYAVFLWLRLDRGSWRFFSWRKARSAVVIILAASMLHSIFLILRHPTHVIPRDFFWLLSSLTLGMLLLPRMGTRWFYTRLEEMPFIEKAPHGPLEKPSSKKDSSLSQKRPLSPLGCFAFRGSLGYAMGKALCESLTEPVWFFDTYPENLIPFMKGLSKAKAPPESHLFPDHFDPDIEALLNKSALNHLIMMPLMTDKLLWQKDPLSFEKYLFTRTKALLTFLKKAQIPRLIFLMPLSRNEPCTSFEAFFLVFEAWLMKMVTKIGLKGLVIRTEDIAEDPNSFFHEIKTCLGKGRKPVIAQNRKDYAFSYASTVVHKIKEVCQKEPMTKSWTALSLTPDIVVSPAELCHHIQGSNQGHQGRGDLYEWGPEEHKAYKMPLTMKPGVHQQHMKASSYTLKTSLSLEALEHLARKMAMESISS